MEENRFLRQIFNTNYILFPNSFICVPASTIPYFTVMPEEKGGLIDCYSHGIEENLNHLDLQLVLPISMDHASAIINAIGLLIQEGRVFEPDVTYTDVLAKDVPMKFVQVKDNLNNRQLLRIILPDANFKFPEDKDCMALYDLQYNPTHETSGKNIEIPS